MVVWTEAPIAAFREADLRSLTSSACLKLGLAAMVRML